MKFVHRVSLKTRLALLTAVSAIAVLTFGAVALYRNLEHQISNTITAELRVRATDVAAVFAQDRTDESSAVPVVAQVIDPSGNVLSPLGQPSLLSPSELAAAFNGEFIDDRKVDAVGDHARVLARATDTRRGRVVVVAATSTEPLEAARSRLLIVLGIAGPSLAITITAVAWLLTNAALRPVQRMTSEAESISLAEPGHRLPQPEGRDEIAQLGHTLNQMLARIETTIMRERGFIDDASHELRTPLAVLRGELELASQRPDDPHMVRESLASALEETDRLTNLAENLLTLARADAGQLNTADERTPLLAAVRSTIDHLRTDDRVRLEINGADEIVRGEPRTVEQIITNLLINALRYARQCVRITITRQASDVTVVVADDGPGFPTDLLPHVFERFTRGDSSRGRTGTGLGLAIVASLANALGGRVSARNGPPLGGACVTVQLQAAQPAP